MHERWLFRVPGDNRVHAVLRRFPDFGIESLDLAGPPLRLWADQVTTPPLVSLNTDARRLEPVPTPAELLVQGPGSDTWHALSKRSVNRLRAWYLLAEDPQRRLDTEVVVKLAHQASLVHHVLQEPDLRRVMIADEVGLGKTVEAGLIIKDLLEASAGLRILYLAPARLVSNVQREFDRLGLAFRIWIAGNESTATLDDGRVIASIHRATHPAHTDSFARAVPWDVIVVDECHHLSDWGKGGGKPTRKYQLVNQLRKSLASSGRLILMSGTPHQGHPDRFENLLRLLRLEAEPEAKLAGRVIYRTKEDVVDWNGQPLFPRRQVNSPLVMDLGPAHRRWLERIHDFFEPAEEGGSSPGRRAAGWRCGQALQWATSSIQAGLGYLARQAIRAGWNSEQPALLEALQILRPYRKGSPDEPVRSVFDRMAREVGIQAEGGEIADLEEPDDDAVTWRPDPASLSALLIEGVRMLRADADAKWRFIWENVLRHAGNEKVVLFAQPIETVTALSGFLERSTGRRPALIVGNQVEAERLKEIEGFSHPDGPQFLVSSRAGGEGLNLQVSRRLVHVDVPWNPMEMEQRVGRVHRFKSRKTIIVDTVVVKDSREVHAYQLARDKLQEIASALVPEEQFQGLFSRVMTLVAPEELTDLLAERAVGPLNDDEHRRLSDLVSEGFQRWRGFHERFSGQQRRVSSLDPGLATWSDVADFAEDCLAARRVTGYSAQKFRWSDGEVIEESSEASVVEIDGSAYALGDHEGNAVLREDGASASRLGLNIPPLSSALRSAALPEGHVGAAHLGWPTGKSSLIVDSRKPAGVLVLARHSVRAEQGLWIEGGTTLHAFVVGDSDTSALTGSQLAELVRVLTRATVRLDAKDAPDLVERLRIEEQRLMMELRRPSEDDRTKGIGHAVVPLVAAVVTG